MGTDYFGAYSKQQTPTTNYFSAYNDRLQREANLASNEAVTPVATTHIASTPTVVQPSIAARMTAFKTASTNNGLSQTPTAPIKMPVIQPAKVSNPTLRPMSQAQYQNDLKTALPVDQAMPSVTNAQGKETMQIPIYNAIKNFANSEALGLPVAIDNATGSKLGLADEINQSQVQTPIASKIGEFAGYLDPGSALDKGVTALAKPILEKAAGNTAAEIATRAGTAALSNAALAGISDKLQGQSNSQTLKDVGVNAAIGGVLGGAGAAIPKAIEALKTAGIENNAISHAQDLLGKGADATAIATERDPQVTAIANKIANGEVVSQNELDYLHQNATTAEPTVRAENVPTTANATESTEKSVEQPNLNNPLNMPVKSSNADYGNALGANQMEPEKVQAYMSQEAENGKPQYAENHYNTDSGIGVDSKVKNQANEYAQRAIGEENVNRTKANQFAADVRNTVKDVRTRQALTHIAETPDAELRAAHLKGIDTNMYNAAKLLDELESAPTDGLDEAALAKHNEDIAFVKNAFDVMAKDIPKNIENLDRPMVLDGEHTTLRKMLTDADNLNDVGKQTAQNGTDFTNDVGALSKQRRTIDDTIPNYLVHSYEPPKIENTDAQELERDRQLALREKIMPKNGGGVVANNSAHRVYPDYATAIMHGETPKTQDMANLVEKTGNDAAHRNALAGLADDMLKDKVAQSHNRVYYGYSQIGSTADGKKIQIPTALFKKLTPIFDPGYLKISKYDWYNDLIRTTKHANMGVSLVHYKNLALAALGNGDIKAFGHFIAQIPQKFTDLGDTYWRERELDGVKHGLMTTMTSENLDTGARLSEPKSFIGKGAKAIGELPGAKQLNQGMKANTDFLFGKFQREIKVQAYGENVDKWMAKNPTATDAQITTAKRSIARALNGVYGGENWQALRLPRLILGTMKKLIISPDWTWSNIDLAKQACTDWGKTDPKANILKNAINVISGSPGGNMARAYWLRSTLIFGGILEGGNFLASGHGTWENGKGHELDIQQSNGTYISTLTGALHDAATLTGDVVKHGVQGVPEFFEGKGTPPIRVVSALLSGKDYTGKSLQDSKGDIGKTVGNYANMVVNSGLGIPFGIVPTIQYLAGKDNPQKNALSAALIGSGLAKYSSDASTNAAEPYTGNWMYGLTQKGQAEQQLNQTIKSAKAATKSTNAAKNANNPAYVAKKALAAQENSTIKSFVSMSKTNRANLLNSLPADQRKVVTDELDRLNISY